MDIRGYIFDIDHTLLNSDDAHISAALWAFDQHGLKRTAADILAHFDKATDDIFRLVAGPDYRGDPLVIAQEKTVKFIETVANVPHYPRVNAILAKIHENGGKIAFVSNNYNEVIEAMLVAYGWDKISEGFVGIDDVTNRKPHPEMVLQALNKLQLKPEECVMIGDSAYDVQAGEGAGTHTIGVCTGHYTREQFEDGKVRPNIILDSITALEDMIPLSFE